jgi:PAS domain-containing protein
MAGLSEGVILIGQDARILGLNPAAERLFGYDPDELVGQASSAVLPVDVSRWFGDPDPNVVILERSDFIDRPRGRGGSCRGRARHFSLQGGGGGDPSAELDRSPDQPC